MNKQSLRKELLTKLSQLSNDEIISLNFSLTNQIIKFFHSSPELSAQIGGAYLPLRSEIAPAYQELLREVPLSLAYPILKGGQMSFGIPQGMPRGATWLDQPYHEVDPIWFFVPGVSFDLNGARLGRGKGYYDQYFDNREGLKIGLAWSEQVLEKVPVEGHDCHMDYIITENFCWDVGQQKRF